LSNYKVSGQNDNAQMEFMQRWMSSHWTDSKTILKKPLVFAEFGKLNKDPGYNTSVRDSFLIQSIQASTTLQEMKEQLVVDWFGKFWLKAWTHIMMDTRFFYLKIHQQAVSLLNSLIR